MTTQFKLVLKIFIAVILIATPQWLLAQDQQPKEEEPQETVKPDETDSTESTDSTIVNKVDSIPPAQVETPAELKKRVLYQDTVLETLRKQLESMKQDSKQNATAIHGLMQGKQIDNETKYKLMKSNLINATETYYFMNRKIIDLKSRTTANNLEVFITALNNPESKALGFSFSEKILDLVKSVILKGKVGKSKRNEDIVNNTQSILKSPIFNSVIALSPPLAIGNSIMTFFHSLSVSDKKINTDMLNEFEKEMNKYVSYYSALNEGNQKFQYGLSFNSDQLNLLQQNMYDHLLFTSSAMNFPKPTRGDDEPLGVSLNNYFLTFNRDAAIKFFGDLEKKYTQNGKVNYEQLLRENMSLKEANNQLEELVSQTNRFTNLYNEYFTLINSYYGQVINALNLAQTNGLADKNLIKVKQDEFNGLRNQAITDIKASINIKELHANTDDIKYRYKIF